MGTEHRVNDLMEVRETWELARASAECVQLNYEKEAVDYLERIAQAIESNEQRERLNDLPRLPEEWELGGDASRRQAERESGARPRVEATRRDRRRVEVAEAEPVRGVIAHKPPRMRGMPRHRVTTQSRRYGRGRRR
jgi:hypothetical protein